MKTYWFTIAEGNSYNILLKDLQKSAKKFEIEINNFNNSDYSIKKEYQLNEQSIIKINKILGILNAPSGYDRIVYLDADTLISNLNLLNEQNGALKEPWGMGNVPFVVDEDGFLKKKRREKKLWELLKRYNLFDFCPGGKFYRQEWNSGVIIGDRKFLEELCIDWLKWWLLILEVNDGKFRRDQMSFKYAYKRIAIDKYGYESISPKFNWIVKRMGVHAENIAIYHKAGAYLPQDELNWEEIKNKII